MEYKVERTPRAAWCVCVGGGGGRKERKKEKSVVVVVSLFVLFLSSYYYFWRFSKHSGSCEHSKETFVGASSFKVFDIHLHQ